MTSASFQVRRKVRLKFARKKNSTLSSSSVACRAVVEHISFNLQIIGFGFGSTDLGFFVVELVQAK